MNKIFYNFKFFNIIIIYNFLENKNIFFIKKIFKTNYIFFLKKKKYNFINKKIFKNPDIFLINFKKNKYKNNIKKFKDIEILESFLKKKNIYIKYKILIINLKKFLDKELYYFLLNLINKKKSYLKFLIITNNDTIFNFNLNSLNIFVKNKKNIYINKIKNLCVFLNNDFYLIKKWILNKNYKIYYFFIKNILNNFNIFSSFEKILKLKIIIKLFDKFLYDLLIVYMNYKPKFFKNFYKIIKILIKKLNINNFFIFYKKINILKKIKINKNKKVFFLKKLFLEYKLLFKK